METKIPTSKERKLEQPEFEKWMAKVEEARAAILKHVGSNGKSKNVSGAIKCPICGQDNNLRFAVHNNGHVHATCRTKGCVTWVE